MDLMDDDKLKKSVISQMMGELDDVTADSLRKPKGGAGGVEIAITVSPKSEDEMEEELEEACTDPDCENPEHKHGMEEKEPEGDYISDLLKKLG